MKANAIYEGGILEDPWNEPDSDMYLLSVNPEAAPDESTYVEIDFEEGNPVVVDSEKLSPANLMGKLNIIAGANGVGRSDMVENRPMGMKSSGVTEAPGATVLYAAHRAVESITMDREVMLLRDQMSPKIAQIIYNGYWYSPEMDLMTDFVKRSQENVTSTARMKL